MGKRQITKVRGNNLGVGLDLKVQQRKFRKQLRDLNNFSTENLLKKLQKRPTVMLYNFKIPGDVFSHEGQ